jgi:phage terminase large subunit
MADVTASVYTHVEIVTAVNPRLKEEDMVDSLCMVACDEPSKVIAYPAVPEVTALAIFEGVWIEAVEEEEVEEVEEVEVDRRRRRRLTHMICNFCLIK